MAGKKKKVKSVLYYFFLLSTVKLFLAHLVAAVKWLGSGSFTRPFIANWHSPSNTDGPFISTEDLHSMLFSFPWNFEVNCTETNRKMSPIIF